MSETITLSRVAFTRLLDNVMMPDPDGSGDPSGPWGPYGPGGPVIRGLLSQLDNVLLNPQPLPPLALRLFRELLWELQPIMLDPRRPPPGEWFGGMFGPVPDPWRLRVGSGVFGPSPQPWRTAYDAAFGPGPQPWRLVRAARSLIEHAIAQHQWAQVLTGGQATEAIVRQVHEVVDDWCGTVPFRRWPFPWPTPDRGSSSLELLLAGAQFQRAADALGEHDLQRAFAGAADALFETGLRRLEDEEKVQAYAVSAE